MKSLIFLASTIIAVFVTPGGTLVRAADLASAKALYASAAYEDALVMLAAVDGAESVEQVNQIRALCLLALGRTRDAEQAVEQIVHHNPTYQLDKADVSPKLVTVFHDVRRRVLPAAARALYGKAKTSFDEKRWSDAQRDFASLLTIVADPDVADRKDVVADLRQLAEGFLKLSEAEVAAEARRAEEVRRAEEAKRAAEEAATAAAVRANQPPPASPVAAPSTAGRQPAAGAAGIPVFTALDPTVTPPIELRRVMPKWAPTNRAMASMTLTGLIEIVIDETGAVTSAAMVKPVAGAYDQLLLQATKTWRYSPASKDGRAVRYRQVLEIVLRPATQQE